MGLCLRLSSCSGSLVTCLRVSQPRQGSLGYWGITCYLPSYGPFWHWPAATSDSAILLEDRMPAYFLVFGINIYTWTSAYFKIFWRFKKVFVSFFPESGRWLGRRFRRTGLVFVRLQSMCILKIDIKWSSACSRPTVVSLLLRYSRRGHHRGT